MAVVAVASPLCALGMAQSRFDPVRRVPRLFAPVPVSVAELVVVFAWHTPGLHHAARTETAMFVLEQTSFLVAGLWLWLSVAGGTDETREERRGASILALLLTSVHMTLLGALLALPARPLFAHHTAHTQGPLTPLEDQHLGGAIMLTVGGVVYLTGGVVLSARMLNDRRRRAQNKSVRPALGPHEPSSARNDRCSWKL